MIGRLMGNVYVLCLSKKTVVGMGWVHRIQLYESLLYSEKGSFFMLQWTELNGVSYRKQILTEPE